MKPPGLLGISSGHLRSTSLPNDPGALKDRVDRVPVDSELSGKRKRSCPGAVGLHEFCLALLGEALLLVADR